MHQSAKRTACKYYTLARGKVDRNMEPFFLEVLPVPDEDHKLSSHQGEEFIMVHSGKLLVIYGTKQEILEPDDSVYYNSIVPH